MADLLRKSVYQSIRRAIIDCELLLGQEFRETTLAEKYHVSRSPVRDALLVLESEHLVTVLPRQGYVINPIDRKGLDELFDLRHAVSPASAASAAAADEASRRDLSRFRYLPRSNEALALLDYDRAFHHRIAELVSNKRLQQIEFQLVDEFERIMALAFRMLGSPVIDAVVSEHVRIIDAVLAGDSEVAFLSMREHVEAARTRIMGTLRWDADGYAIVQPTARTVTCS